MEKHSHCFIITLSGVESIKMLSCYVVYLKLIYYYKSIILQLKKKKETVTASRTFLPLRVRVCVPSLDLDGLLI